MELLHEPMGPEHLSPAHSVLINDSFSAAWGVGGGGGEEEDEADSEIRGERTDCYTVHCVTRYITVMEAEFQVVWEGWIYRWMQTYMHTTLA